MDSRAFLLPINWYEENFRVYALSDFIDHLNLVMPLINILGNMTFFVKNIEARYVLANENLVKRCQVLNSKLIIGRRAEEVFCYEVGIAYTEQDFCIMETKRYIINRLELHSYKSGVLGWCMTTKIPIIDVNDCVVGVAGISIDIQDDKSNRPHINNKIINVEKYINKKIDSLIRIEDLAKIAELSVSQLERQFRNIFQMTIQQFIQKKRMDYAIELLAKNISISDVSMYCGYTDHSAFSRKFKELTTLTPSQFRKQLKIN